MILIKIYDKSYNPLTTFLFGEYGGLSYSSQKHQVGDARFNIDLNNPKVTEANMQHYNRVEVVEDGIVRWAGFIVRKEVSLTTVDVRCRELIGLFKKRLTSSSQTVSGAANTALTALLTSINAADDTGITAGTLDISDTLNLTFKYDDVFSVLRKSADVVGGEFNVDANRQLNFKTTLGNDLSASVVLRYNVNQISIANITRFSVTDDGDNVVSKAYGKSGALSTAQENATIKGKYGLLEKSRNYQVANAQGDLDAIALADTKDQEFAPDIVLDRTILDNFEVGDIVRVEIKNRLVDIDDNFQILKKSVTMIGSEKQITVGIDNIPENIAETIKNVTRRVDLIENNI